MSDETLASDAAMDAEPISVSAPVVATERIDAIDKLRGIAVAGIRFIARGPGVDGINSGG